MTVHKTQLASVVMTEPKRYGDHWGRFVATYNRKAHFESGTDATFVQDNDSNSAVEVTGRGLLLRVPPRAQVKLVRCGRGTIYDVAVDTRRSSATYGSWVSYLLGSEYGAQLYILAGFAQGTATLEPESEIIYRCNDYYAPEAERALRWDDPDIGIEWPLVGDPIFNGKGAHAPLFAELNSPFSFEG